MSTPQLARVIRLDSVRLDESFFTKEGYLMDAPVVTSVGIFEYKNPDGSKRRELRLPEHVFDPKSLATYEGKPVIITHQAVTVDKDNVDEEHVGTMLTKGYRDGDDVRVKVVIHHIDEVKMSGLRELSLGYELSLIETPGEWNGEPYDAIQTDIRVNHLALVGDARAGDHARLNLDGKSSLQGGKTMSAKKGKAMSGDVLKKTIAAYRARQQQRLDAAEADGTGKCDTENTDAMMPNDIETPEVAVPPADRISFIKNRRDRRDQDGDPGTLEEAIGVIAQEDEDICTLLDIIEEMTAKADMSEKSDTEETENEDEGDDDGGEVTLKIQTDGRDVAAMVDAKVKERTRLLRLGDRLNLDGLEDMSPLEAKKAIIKAVKPNIRLDGKSAKYIATAFDIAVDEMGAKDTDYQRRQMTRMDGRDPAAPTGKTSAQRARERMIERQMNGGKE
jgi:hypothetical protein